MTNTYLYIDIETRSKTDLIAHGGYRYNKCPSTELICVSYALNDNKIITWFPEDGPIPSDLYAYLSDNTPHKKIVAHNAAFERLFFENQGHKYDLPLIDLNRWVCSSATCMAVGLPAKLSDVAIALDLFVKKMPEGTRLIRDYCTPHNYRAAWKPGDKELMQDYCETDVAVMRTALKFVPQLNDDMLRQYHITEEMNDLGVPVDIRFAKAAIAYSEDIRADINVNIEKITHNKVESHSARKTRDEWLREQLTVDQLEVLMVNDKIKFDQPRRTALLNVDDLPFNVRDFTEQVDAAGGATVKKFSAMVNTHVNGNCHGNLIWSGAGASGRYSSRGLQLQNMKRDVFDDPEPYIQDVIDGYEIDSPSHTLAKLCRAAITNESGLTWSDFSQIEARVLPWLSADKKADDLLDAFYRGDDIYTLEARKWFHLDEISKEMRQAAKIGVLACGFQGGFRAVQAMAANYGMIMSAEEATSIKTQWRAANGWAEPFWNGLYDSACSAVRAPGEVFEQGRIRLMCQGEWLWLELPSGRCLGYYQPKFEYIQSPWEDAPSEKLTALWGAGKRKAGEAWPRRTLYGGLFSQNATQGTAADIMREAITRAYDAGLDTILTVHDEMVCLGYVKDALHDVMITPPSWAEGLPIAADTTEGKRYGK